MRRKPAARRLKSIARLRSLFRTSREPLATALARRSAATGGESAASRGMRTKALRFVGGHR